MVSWTCDGVETCTVNVVVTDDGTPAPALSDTETLTIECTDVAPQITSTPPANATENVAYTYDITCTDADLDALTLAKGAGDTCAGILVDNDDGTGTYMFTPDENQGGTSCDVQVTCTDTQDTDTHTTTVNISEDNRAPVITNLPATEPILVGSPGSYDADAVDPDIPADVLTWSLGADTCSSFALSIDTTTGVVSWTCGGAETCTVSVVVTDDGTPAPALSDAETLTIQCASARKLVRISTGHKEGNGSKEDGILVSRGGYARGQPGGGTTTVSHSLIKVKDADAGWLYVDESDHHSCAIGMDGTLWCWGENTDGQIGDGTTTDRDTPTLEAYGDGSWTVVSASDGHTCAVRSDGSLWCWGSNAHGQLGDGTTTRRTIPTREMNADADWMTVSAGVGHTCGIRQDGTLWCWGWR